MSEKEVEKIKQIFSKLKINAKYLTHVPVITSQEAAETRGISIEQGIKAILFTDGDNYVIVNVPAHLKVDVKKVSAQMNWPKSQIRMATHEEVLNITGCEVGSVPPFGHKTHIPLLVDTKVYNNSFNDFNIGLRTHSAHVATADMKLVFKHEKAIEGDFVKSGPDGI